MIVANEYRRDVDGIRAIAVILVLLFHAFPKLAPAGFIGVDVFFVISGFLITNIIVRAGPNFSFLNFYSSRIRRIFPALCLVLAAVLIFGFMFTLPIDYKLIGWHIVASSLFLANIQMWAEAGYFDTAAHLKPLLHLWSLGVEEQFYLMYPILLVCVVRTRSPVVWLSMLAAVSFAFNIWISGVSPSVDFYLPMSRMWELFAGCVLALRPFDKRDNRRVQDFLSLLGLLLIFLALIFIDPLRQYPGSWACLPVAGAVLLLGSKDSFINRRILGWPPLVYVGLISYPLYLWHWPLLTFPNLIYPGGMDSSGIVIAVVLAFALAALTFRYVEQPIRHLNANRKPLRSAIPILLGLMCLVGFSGLLVFTQDGFVHRTRVALWQSKGVSTASSENAMGSALSVVPKNSLASLNNTVLRLSEWDYGNPSNCELVPELFGRGSDCVFLKPKTTTIAIFGDSYAQHLVAGLTWAYAPSKEGVKAFTQPICLPVLDTDCDAKILPELREILASDNIKTVILAGKWWQHTYCAALSQLTVGGNSIPCEVRSRLIEESLENIVAKLIDKKKEVILVDSLPHFGGTGPFCLESILANTARHFCRVDLSVNIRAASFEFEAILKRLRLKQPRLRIFYPTDILCNEGICIQEVGSLMLIRPDNHLSLFGSVLVARELVTSQR